MSTKEKAAYIGGAAAAGAIIGGLLGGKKGAVIGGLLGAGGGTGYVYYKAGMTTAIADTTAGATTAIVEPMITIGGLTITGAMIVAFAIGIARIAVSTADARSRALPPARW